MAAWALIAVLGGRRTELDSKVQAVLLIAEIAVAVILAVIQVAHPAKDAVYVMTLSPTNLFTAALGAALATPRFAGYAGSGRHRRVQRRVPRSLAPTLATFGLGAAVLSVSLL